MRSPSAAAEWTDGGEDRRRDRLLDPAALKIVAVLDGEPVGLARGVVEQANRASCFPTAGTRS
jgi:hypothetical protein